MTTERAASMFMLHAVQEWGQSEEERVAAVQGVLDTAGFKAKAESWPVFGGIWRKKCTGPDGDAASIWLKNLTDTMKCGSYNDEKRHVEKAINDRLHPADSPDGGR